MASMEQPASPAVTFVAFVTPLILMKLAVKEIITNVSQIYNQITKPTITGPVERVLTSTMLLDYLRASFDQPELLVKGMAKTNFILSGWRALDIFIPGSAFTNSDWDFYIPDHRDAIGGAMSTLAKCGVVWHPPASSAQTTDTRNTGYGTSVNIVRCCTTFNGTSQRVHLISSHGKMPLDLILDFCASHVQCFISAFGAVHFYMPSNKAATVWQLNTQHRPSANAALEKYKQRGYTFETKGQTHGHRQLRQLSDNLGQSKLVEFQFGFEFEDVPMVLQSLRRQALRKIMWVETGERTYRVVDAEVDEAFHRWSDARRRRLAKEAIEDGNRDGGDDLDYASIGVSGQHLDFATGLVRVRDTVLLF